MANTISNLSYANTFGDWVVTTNALVKENNDFASNNYVKPTGTLYLNDPTLGLQSGNTVVAGQLAVQGIGSSAYVQNNLRVDNQVYFTNTVLGLVNSGQANIGGLLFAQGSGTGLLVANTANVGGQLNVTGATRLSNTLTVVGKTQLNNELSVTGNTLISNSMYVTADVHFGNTLSVVANTDVSGYVNVTYDVVANNTSTVNNTQTKTLGVTQLATIQVSQTDVALTNTGYTKNLIANTSLTTPLANIGTTLDANNATGYFKTIQTTGQLSVGGNFVINGSTVYSTNTFTLSAGSGVGQTSYFNVNRGSSGANASIRWNESSKIFDMIDVDTSTYYRVLTNQYFNDTITSTSTTSVATANVANTLNNILTSQNTSIQNTLTATTARLAAGYTQANSAANTIVGTTGSINPTNASITLTSNNGITFVATGANTMAISTSQDLRTTGSPTFAGMTLTNALAIPQGGTGATSAADARTAILPTGTTAGYVLTTGGPGTFYWAAPTGGGGSGVVPGQSINSTRLSYTGDGANTIYAAPSYVPGASQLRIYIDGVRQFASEYTETSNTSLTFTSAPPSGSKVLVEVDGYYNNPYYANNITFTAPFSGIVSTANTIQLAIQDLETRKAPLANATFTGTTSTVTPDSNTSSTTVATTAFVKNVLNSGNTFALIAGAVTNGVYTNGSYSDPTWLTITKSKVGLANVDNTADANKSVNYATSAGSATTAASASAVAWTNVTSRPTALSSFTNDLGNYGSWITATSNADTKVNSLGVGTNASTTAGEIRATNDITAFYTSDIAFKENVQEIQGAVNIIDAIGGKTFDWKDNYIANKGGEDGYFVRKNDFGVIAQDVEAAFPLAVRKKPDGTLAVDYEKLVAVAFAAIKELKAELDALKGK